VLGSEFALGFSLTSYQRRPTMIGGFAIVPDQTQQPAALFTELEHAMD
jgi:hypothetical protein